MSATLNGMPSASATHGDKTKARALALAMHAAFLVLLIFGVSWQRTPQAPVVADLWSSLPPMEQPAQPKAEVTPEPEPEPPPKPAPRVEPPPAPKAEPVPVPKPDFALKKKIEKEKKAVPKVEPRAEPKKRGDDLAKREHARIEKEKSDAKVKEDEQRKITAQKASEAKAAQDAQDKLVNEFKDRIGAKVRQNIVEPPGLQGNPTAEFDVVVIPGGEVLSVRLVRSSGVPAYDAAAERAIMKSAPLPLPPNPELFSRFRDLHLSVRPKQ